MAYDYNLELKKGILHIAYDPSTDKEQSLLVVSRMVGNDMYYKTFSGEDADFVYELLTTKSVPKAIRDWCEKEYKENGW